MTDTSMPGQPCFNCQSNSHQGEHCPISLSIRDLMIENANVMGKNRPPTDAQHGNTYNPKWKNHPNLALKPKPPIYVDVPLEVVLQARLGWFFYINNSSMVLPFTSSSHQPHHLLSKLS